MVSQDLQILLPYNFTIWQPYNILIFDGFPHWTKKTLDCWTHQIWSCFPTNPVLLRCFWIRNSDAQLGSQQAIPIYSSVHSPAVDPTLQHFLQLTIFLPLKDFFAYLLKTWKPISFVISNGSSSADLLPPWCLPSLIKSIV